MTGETDLSRLIRGMQPELHPGEVVFCCMDATERVPAHQALGSFRENEGWTVILPKSVADKLGLPYPTVFAWITLTVHSSLEAVGLTAAVSHALTEAGIPCNVVAAFYHDHLFVPVKDAAQAMQVLRNLAAG
jgi:uncharacterized protein